MATRPKAIRRKGQKEHPLIGTWVNGDEYLSDVEYTIAQKDGNFGVRAIDRYDDEEAEIRDVTYEDDKSTLFFTVYWNSTGRFVKARVMATSQNRISYTYTFTEQQMWFRKGTEPQTGKKPPLK
jgi:hypothetical protein